MERSIKRYTSYENTLSGTLACYAAHIEDAWLLCGARPGVDYCLTDIMNMAYDYFRLQKPALLVDVTPLSHHSWSANQHTI